MRAARPVIPGGPRGTLGPLPPGKRGGGGTAKGARLSMEASSWRMRDGARWRGIPERFGRWNSIHRRFREWAKRGIFDRIHKELRGEIDLECAMTGGATAQAHRKASSAGKALGKQAIGRCRGGLTTKIPGVADARGRLVDFRPLPGQAHELTRTQSPLEEASFGALTAEGTFDAGWPLAELNRRKAVIPSGAHRMAWRGYDVVMRGWRCPVESFFAMIREYRAIATRYDEPDSVTLLADASPPR